MSWCTWVQEGGGGGGGESFLYTTFWEEKEDRGAGEGEVNVYVIKAITKPITKLMRSLKNPRAQKGVGVFFFFG